MDSLPQWDALSQAAQAQLLASVQSMLAADVRYMTPTGNEAVWDELISTGIVNPLADKHYLTGPGTCLVLDVLEATAVEGELVAA